MVSTRSRLLEKDSLPPVTLASWPPPTLMVPLPWLNRFSAKVAGGGVDGGGGFGLALGDHPDAGVGRAGAGHVE